MSAKKHQSSRKRSRPVEKHSVFDKLKKNKISLVFLVLFIVILVVIGVYFILNNTPVDEQNEPEGNPIAVFDTTSGSFRVELYEDRMPITCANFIKLVNDGFYDGMIFHRVMNDFMIQAGKSFPDGTTSESPYGNIVFEESNVTHVDGAISMASTGAGVGGSAEFFICDGVQEGLDGNYAAFGVVVDNMSVVRSIAAEEHDGSYGSVGGGKPYNDIIINSIKIENN